MRPSSESVANPVDTLLPTISEPLTRLENWFELAAQLDWKSYDPFDLLLSPYLCKAQDLSSFVARCVVQLGKLLGTGLRQALKIVPHEEAKTISDYLSAAVILTRCQQSWASTYIDTLSDRLKNKAIVSDRGWGWGLEFPYTSRFVNASARTPNAYQTTLAVQAFLDVYELASSDDALQCALSGCDHVLHSLGDFEYGGRRWFQYWPARYIPAANIQALIASMLARMGTCLEKPDLVELADRCADTVVSVQRDNGSWRYSEDGRADFTDGFHTGFVLQGLREYLNYREREMHPRVYEAVQAGLLYFKRHLIAPEGLPRYFADGQVSLDGQNFAQCVQTLVICAENSDDTELALKMWKNMMCLGDNLLPQFPTVSKYSKKPKFISLRWTLGPAVLATAHLLAALCPLSRQKAH